VLPRRTLAQDSQAVLPIFQHLFGRALRPTGSKLLHSSSWVSSSLRERLLGAPELLAHPVPRKISTVCLFSTIATSVLNRHGSSITTPLASNRRVESTDSGKKSLLEQLRGLWNILGTQPSVYEAIFSNFQA
jgi:hypothetical protein